MDRVTPPTTIRVLVVDDDPLVRAALALMLGGQSDLVLVGEAGNGAEAIEMTKREHPQVVLMDIRMPVMSGIDATAALKQLPESPSVIVLTTFHADEHVLAAVAAGADSFLLKDTPPPEIVAAIRRVADGEAMLSPAVTRTVLERMRMGAPDDRQTVAYERIALLTAREREVAICVGKGMSNAEIASDLYLSIPTVKAHVSRLFEKFEASNRVQIAMVMHDAGLV